MSAVNENTIRRIGDVLSDTSKPLKQRFRSLFTLKNLGGHTAIDCIASAFDDSSALLKHELAYCLGQMKDPYAIPHLSKILGDVTQEPMVRHEAGKIKKKFYLTITELLLLILRCYRFRRSTWSNRYSRSFAHFEEVPDGTCYRGELAFHLIFENFMSPEITVTDYDKVCGI